jgi:hypothetical protein
MNTRRTVLERAYDLAKSGDCAGVAAIRTRLKAEGYHDVDAALYGRTVATALRRHCLAARSERTSDA